MSNREIIVLEDASALAVRAAEEIVHLSGEAICSRGEFALCLTGGNTPAPVYELIANRFKLSVDWNAVQLFWGDERCVGPQEPASNYAMAAHAMLDTLKLPAAQIHRMHGEDEPEAAARAYEDDLREYFGLEAGEPPRFDLILLGLGDNVHVASLFPGNPALHEHERLVVPVTVDAPQPRRITLTPPVLNAAGRVMFIVSGANKAEAVKTALEGPRDPERFPAQIVDPAEGEVMWLLDKAAAGRLSNP